MLYPLLFFLALPLAVGAIVCSVLSSTPEVQGSARDSAPQRIGAALWFALAISSVLIASSTGHDWQHMFWSVHYPMAGLFASSGLFLAGDWPGDAEPDRPLARRPGTLLAVIGTLVVVGLTPLVLLTVQEHPSPPPRATGRPLDTLVETARSGFGGPIPELMRPETRSQIERGLGHPPREVTAPMGSTGIAAVWITLVCWLAILGRWLSPLNLRQAFVTLAPLAVVAFLVAEDMSLRAVWTNEPWLVRSYGPALLAAAVSIVALLLAMAWNARPRKVPTR